MPRRTHIISFGPLTALLAWLATLAVVLHMHSELTHEFAVAMDQMAEMRTQALTEPPPRAAQLARSGVGLAGNAERRLAKLGMVDWASKMPNSGCVSVDVSNASVTLPLDNKTCNGHACPPCFGLNATPGMSLHALTLTGCAEMYVSDTLQLGSGVAQNALQQLEFVNLNMHTAVAISDGVRTFLIPPGAHVWGDCLAGGSSEIHMDMSLQKYFKPGGSFTLTTSAASWSARSGHAAVVRADGAVLVLGGEDDPGYKNDVYSSADGGATWMQLTSAAAWSARIGHAAVVRADGAVLVLGGTDNSINLKNDVYSSADGGATWVQLTGAAAWSARWGHAAVVRADGAVLVLGGFGGSGNTNDVYSSADGGATWMQLTGAAAWSARSGHAAVVRADGAVLVLGGFGNNDVYSSADGGATWMQLTSAAAWSARTGHAAVVRADGAVLVLGGNTRNDVYSSEA